MIGKNGDHHKQLQQQPQPPQKVQVTQAKHPQTLNYQKPLEISEIQPKDI